MDSLNLFEAIKAVEDPCKGVFFRGYSSMFFNRKTNVLEKREGFRLLKKKSCLGHNKEHKDYRSPCDWLLWEEIGDYMEFNLIIFPEKIKNGGLYSIKLNILSRDFETGYVDDYEIEFFEVKEEQKPTNV